MVKTYLLSEIDSVAREILDNTKSKTLLFYGEMGAGKTTLIKSLVKALGATDIASSPTFSLVNEYETEIEPIYHFDFYRIENENEALDMGIEDYLNSTAWKFIEWPQKIEKFIESEVQKVEISSLDKASRMLKLS
ncbi:tRNA (adenosine(37)-N6)-threonylcarbamoyltransferase complex ATPase subunit type 1 TsaE [Salinimicrobium sp. GXAS 041]|uniref:tRNA (adenosine(37)-N6)-threonylcarbamoyltransferase complex ATPase subunit type 1 TsaE n=1 Tax=Salinimicrobium sp. GXAS 041 TaxID=3400806 RepID=UPI003C793CB3